MSKITVEIDEDCTKTIEVASVGRRGPAGPNSIAGLLDNGANVTITGSGTIDDPYIISASGGGAGGDPTWISPVFTYDGNGRVSQIDYVDGSFKIFTYTGALLTKIEFTRATSTNIRKIFAYTGQVLDSITQTTF